MSTFFSPPVSEVAVTPETAVRSTEATAAGDREHKLRAVVLVGGIHRGCTGRALEDLPRLHERIVEGGAVFAEKFDKHRGADRPSPRRLSHANLGDTHIRERILHIGKYFSRSLLPVFHKVERDIGKPRLGRYRTVRAREWAKCADRRDER